jgi:septum formation protein
MPAPLLPQIILASASPRRRDLLGAMGLEFESVASGVDEDAIQAGSPRAFALKAASAKAHWVAEHRRADARGGLVLGADTIVVLDNSTMGKPTSPAHARAMLSALAGRTHEVITALALESACDGSQWVHAETTLVTFNPLDAATVERYAASGEADDKAGAYGIQGLGGRLIASIQGELSNVIGLPVALLCEGLRQTCGPEAVPEVNERRLLLAVYPDLAGYPFFQSY